MVSADDAFGLTLGTETIGLYSPQSVRGFSPQTAGNARINGLYFDQQGALSNRVIEESTIRVGVSEIGYAFPAPTGIVDYDLRHVTNDKATATVVASAGPFEAVGISVDGSLPLVANRVQLPVGVSYQISTQTPTGPNPGYTSTVANVGAAPIWTPNDLLVFRALYDWTRTTDAKTLPVVFTAGDFLPPTIRQGYLGQDWAQGQSLSENFGGIVEAKLSPRWSFAAGIFRSISDSPLSYADLYVDTLPSGLADHQLVGYPDQRVASTSGEARLTTHFRCGSATNEFILLVRGRDAVARYGGSDVVDAGPALIGEGLQVPKPSFRYGATTDDRTLLRSTGLAYRGQWSGHADVALGVQRENYQKTVVTPAAGTSRLADAPWRVYGTVALPVAARTTLYAGYTQGLEDSGVAPSNAENRGAILPAARTWQADAGLRYVISPKVKLIAGIFDLNKPYFNLDTSNVDRQLASQRATGLELSLSGELVKNLTVNVGAVFGQVRVIGANLHADGIGGTAFGQPRNQIVADLDYSFPRWSAFSVDLGVAHFGYAPASVDGVVSEPAFTLLNVGARYRSTLWGAPATLRVQALNVTNTYVWNVFFSPGFYQFLPRTFLAYLTVDV